MSSTATFKTCWRVLFRPYWGWLLGVFGLAFLTGVAGMLTVGLGVPLIDVAMSSGASPSWVVLSVQKVFQDWGIASDKNLFVLVLLVLICLVGMVYSLLLFVAQWFSVVVAQKGQIDTKVKLFEQVVRTPYSYMTAKNRGALLCDLSNPSQAVYQLIDLFGRMSVSYFQAALMVALMVYFSWEATAVIGLLGILWWWKLKKIWGGWAARYGREIYEWNRVLSQADVDAVDGIKVVKSHTLESKLVSLQRLFLEKRKRPQRMVELLTRGVVLFNEALAGIVVIVLGIAALGLHWIDMTFAQVVAFMIAIRRASPSIGTFQSMALQFLRDLKNIEVIDELLNQTPVETGGSEKIARVETINLNRVSFTYPSLNAPVLEEISLNMERGQMTAIVGATGSGKTTLAHLLLRFWNPTEGEISVNQTSLSNLDLPHWRQKVGYVSQDVFLFNDTIRNNISLWTPFATLTDVEEVARLAQLHDFVVTLPQGYETTVGDRGVRLSGGQAQRLAIAREILKKPEVFIFDEATSALDNLTERAVYEAIASFRSQAVILVIAHRLTTIRDADQIIVLDSGKIETVGTHAALMNQKGLYARLYNPA